MGLIQTLPKRPERGVDRLLIQTNKEIDMVKIKIRAKLRETGEFVEHQINVDDKIRKIDNDSLYEFISDFLNEKHGDIFKWFRFWTLP